MTKRQLRQHDHRQTAACALALAAASVLCAAPVRACDWPPLNPIIERQSNPVRVVDVTFMTGYYSYYVNAYSVPSFGCSESITWGPREWRAVIGLGDEPIGPHVESPASGGSNNAQSATSSRPLAFLPPASDRSAPGMNPLPTLPDVHALPPVEALPPLPSLAPLPRLQPLPEIPDLPPLPPLDAR